MTQLGDFSDFSYLAFHLTGAEQFRFPVTVNSAWVKVEVPSNISECPSSSNRFRSPRLPELVSRVKARLST